MPYKDKERVKEASKRYRDKLKGVTPGMTEGMTEEAGITPGMTTFDTPQDVKAAITALTGKWHPVDEWTPAELAAHQARIRAGWCCTGDWSAAYRDLAPLMGWGRR